MKKLIASIALVLLSCGMVARADSTNTVTNQVGQVITTITGSTGVRSVSIEPATQPSSASQAYVYTRGYVLNGSSTSNPASYTPRQIGDMLLWSYGTTNAAWLATGITTNDWHPLYQP